MEHRQPSAANTVAEWACGALHAASPLASHLFDVASSWSVVKQRKGSQLAPAAARQALCNFVGSPCGLFESPDATLRALFAGVATSQAGRRLRVVSLRGVRRTAEQRRLEALAEEHGWEVRRLDAQQLASERSVDVLLLPHSRTAGLTLLAVAEPSLALWFSAEERAAAAWESNRSAGHYSLHLYPGQQWEAAAAASLASAEAAAAAASTPTKGRKRARSRVSVAVGRPRHGVALLWRSAGCASPPYAFDAAGDHSATPSPSSHSLTPAPHSLSRQVRSWAQARPRCHSRPKRWRRRRRRRQGVPSPPASPSRSGLLVPLSRRSRRWCDSCLWRRAVLARASGRRALRGRQAAGGRCRACPRRASGEAAYAAQAAQAVKA